MCIIEFNYSSHCVTTLEYKSLSLSSKLYPFVIIEIQLTADRFTQNLCRDYKLVFIVINSTGKVLVIYLLCLIADRNKRNL